MRALISVVLLCVGAVAHADDFQTAVIVEAGTQEQTNGNAIVQNFGAFSMASADTDNVNVVVLRFGALQVTGQYKTILQGPKAASNLIVGDTVQAKTDGKSLYFVMPESGKTIKAKIMRQERL